MTETRFTWRWLLVIAVVGIFMGLAIGLAAGWIIFPNIGSSNIAGLSASSQNDYIVLVANTFAYDRDDAAAKRRLAALQDKDIKTRVERLAKALAARKDAAAANVADLALELGSDDTSIMVLADQITSADPAIADEPTKSARAGEVEEPTTQPTSAPQTKATDSPKVTAEPTSKLRPQRQTQTAEAAGASNSDADPTEEPAAATDVPDEPTDIPATKAPPPPTAEPTAAAPAPAPVTTAFTPGFPGGWYSTVNFVPANVAAGQKYWRLKSALFCDRPPPGQPPTTDTCPGFPGGENDHSIYVTVLDDNGGCLEASVKAHTNLDETFELEKKNAIYPWAACGIDYERNMNGEGNDIWVDAEGIPSDRINGLVMNSPQLNWGENRVHVRYFLIFQRTTR